ncbi:hypothetical protein M529_19855 [Sphingobium ummariense RL-3]|uniref:Uncharacterized protein n=1 Tax=Sphingobium ummariense RL-3 TaxID=1346791 RepID=T0KAU7_9SPHN|nr:hypothetical protein M529_19855 [Sphingobium ummariense RL-3]
MVRLGEPVLATVFLADAPKEVREDQAHTTLELSELHAIVGEDGVEFVRHRLDQRLQEACGDQLRRSTIDTCKDQLGRAVYGDIEVGLAALVAQFGDIEVEVADLVVLELLRFLAVGLGQLADPMPL